LIVINDEFVTLDTPYGPMHTHIVRPAALVQICVRGATRPVEE
jgi:hypothetical protein